MIMQVLRPRWTNLLENLSALMIILPLVFCAHKQENWLLLVRSAPSPYPYPGAPYLFCSLSLVSSSKSPNTPHGGSIESRKLASSAPTGGETFYLKWKFMFNICICLLLLNWFETVLYQMQITCKCVRNHKPKSGGRVIALNDTVIFNGGYMMVKWEKTLQIFPEMKDELGCSQKLTNSAGPSGLHAIKDQRTWNTIEW